MERLQPDARAQSARQNVRGAARRARNALDRLRHLIKGPHTGPQPRWMKTIDHLLRGQ